MKKDLIPNRDYYHGNYLECCIECAEVLLRSNELCPDTGLLDVLRGISGHKIDSSKEFIEKADKLSRANCESDFAYYVFRLAQAYGESSNVSLDAVIKYIDRIETE